MNGVWDSDAEDDDEILMFDMETNVEVVMVDRPSNPVATLLEEQDSHDLAATSFAPISSSCSSGTYKRDLLDPFNSCKRKFNGELTLPSSTVVDFPVRPRAKRAKSLSSSSQSFSLFEVPLLTTNGSKGMRDRSAAIPILSAQKSPDPSTRSSSSCQATTASSVEYYCRRGLGASSPLRLRFRDLVVGSAGAVRGT